jgi:hypothetical protein
MAFIMGIRFLTDSLSNNVYYKTNYSTHNLTRAKNQFMRVHKIIENQDKINNYFTSCVY